MKCPPLFTDDGHVIVDRAQRDLEAARAAYRRAYNKGYGLSERGQDVKAQAILDQANADLNAAELRYLKARGEA